MAEFYDRKNRELTKWLATLLASDSYVKVGIVQNPAAPGADPGSARKKVRKRRGGVTRAPGLSLAEIATVHEFGAPGANIPERSFLRSTWDENKPKVFRWYKALIKKELSKGTDAKMSIGLIQNQMGNIMASAVKRKFTRNNWPPLKRIRPALARKLKRTGKAFAASMQKPLIDTNQLRGSISYEVVEGKS